MQANEELNSETDPFPTPPLAELLHLCILNPALLLPSHLRVALLAPFHLQGALETSEPFYKHLTNALLTCTETNAPSSTVFELVTTWKEVRLNPQFVNVFVGICCFTASVGWFYVTRSVKFKLHVQEPFFSQLKAGSKTIEGRCAIGAYNSILPGDLLLFNNVLTQVVKMVNHYNSFAEMLKAEGLDQVLPGVSSFAEGVTIYRQFYSEEKELSGGVLAIHVENASEERQPLTMVRIILEELVVYGVEALQSFVAGVVI